MNREIKFRAWDKIYKAMIYPKADNQFAFDFDIKNNKQFLKIFDKSIGGYSTPITTEYIMQYTGLKDKNGKEIYEGDIVFATHPNSAYLHKGKIEWVDGAYWLCEVTLISYDGMEVIGNIYENPKLLEGGEK